MTSLVSILIPCYNSEQWLAEAVESALAQTWTNIEIILVDDGSTDNSLKVARGFESSAVKVITQENRGASAARNVALKEAQGDFIQYLDADDILATDKIIKQIELLQESDGNYLAICPWGRFYESIVKAQFISEPVWQDMSSVDWLVCSWTGGGMMHPAAWLTPRRVSDEAGLWNEQQLSRCPNDDGEYFSRVVLSSDGVKFCPDSRVYYRSGLSGSLSGRKSFDAYQSIFDSFELYAKHLLQRENSSSTRHACATVFQRFVYEAYPDFPELSELAAAKAKELGGSNIKPCGGNKFQLLSKIVGWKTAKRIQKYSNFTAKI